ncbi:MAG TPA: SUMF1/EgtB/PvdO family nonheme iron enzyme [Sedimentisphaerales bacterium]|nr:SUMF1/EgtB/PvdO family nonheme iron enzyme [Sedimentisphaerales bacterium]
MKRGFPIAALVLAVIAWSNPCCARSAGIGDVKEFTNSVGMKLVRIKAGSFTMGQQSVPLPQEIRQGRGMFAEGDYDERPLHEVRITKPFYIGVCEVTNLQYELFDPEHKALRGKDAGLSREDDEAVINVNWYDAWAFCRWLSDQEGLAYRLPTEAEWEYACRAGTTTNFHTGDTLPDEYIKNPGRNGGPDYVPLHVGKTTPNPWGVCDMHGNVEEWCYDFYGPYIDKMQSDPVGYIEGDFKVTRGGSHGTYPYYLRSANRMGTIPEDKHWLIGFRVVMGEMPATQPLARPEPPLNQRGVVRREARSVLEGPDADKPYFEGPRMFVKIPRKADGSKMTGPIFSHHNHNPAVVECPNGDILAAWYTCDTEKDRELAQAASRLVWGESEWQTASAFFDGPDRNDHAPTLWYDEVEQKIYHFYGIAASATWGPLAMVMRTSSDSGATWSKARIISPEHTSGHQLSEAVFRMKDGTIAAAVDDERTLWLSKDNGISWYNPGGGINGTHPGVVELNDGRILALTRDRQVDGKMAMGISEDGGKSYKISASQFPPIGTGQRLALMRLREGPLMLVSFTGQRDDEDYMFITDAGGKQRGIRGAFAAISYDDAKSWPHIRLISDDRPDRDGETRDGKRCTFGFSNSERHGYMSACQGLNGVIHVVSSWNHYAFNLKWLETPPPAEPVE